MEIGIGNDVIYNPATFTMQYYRRASMYRVHGPVYTESDNGNEESDSVNYWAGSPWQLHRGLRSPGFYPWLWL